VDELGIDIWLRVPEYQKIEYQAGLMETIKARWVDFFYIAFPIWLLLSSFLGWVLRSRIFKVQIDEDVE